MRRTKHIIAVFLKYLIMIAFGLTTLVPFYWTLVSSFKPSGEIFGQPFSLPTEYRFDAFRQAWDGINLPQAMGNSFFYCAIAIVCIMLFGSMVAYVLAKVRPNKALYAYFSLGILIPIHAMIIPLNILFSWLNLSNSRTGLILAFIVSNLSLSVFILTASMRNLPDELLQAAQIDGCSRAQAFFRIVLPVSKAALATVGTLAFVNCWNDFLLSLTIITTRELRTLNLAVYNLRSTYTKDYNILTAGITTMIVPAVVIYSIFQEQIIKGMVSGAVKG